MSPPPRATRVFGGRMSASQAARLAVPHRPECTIANRDVRRVPPWSSVGIQFTELADIDQVAVAAGILLHLQERLVGNDGSRSGTEDGLVPGAVEFSIEIERLV